MSASARKPPKLDHVKFVRRVTRAGTVWYAYFNTGQKDGIKPIYAAMPNWGAVGFFDSYAAFNAGRTKRQAKGYSVADLAHEYLQSSEFAKLADNTKLLYRNQLKKVSALACDMPATDFQPSDVREMLDAQEWAAGTENMVIAVIGVIYRWGRRRDKVTCDPVRDIERRKGGEHDPWPDDILEAALSSDDADIRLAVHLLYFTGQRIGDVLKMRWGDIRGGRIFVKQQKTGKIVEPPLAAALQAELDATPKRGVRILEGHRYGPLRRLLQKFTKAKGQETVPHGLRKNAVNVFLEAGCSVAEVASITGQTHAIVEKYAAKVNTRKLSSAAIVKLEAHRNKSA